MSWFFLGVLVGMSIMQVIDFESRYTRGGNGFGSNTKPKSARPSVPPPPQNNKKVKPLPELTEKHYR